MVENVYSLLEKYGYSHPLHPMLTHIPIGMVVAMVVFGFLGLIWRDKNFGETAFHCSVLALVAIPFVISAGLLDWLHYQQGEWSNYIIAKMILAPTLTLLLIFSIILKKRSGTPGRMFLIYLLCLACAGGLGYAGGQLVFG